MTDHPTPGDNGGPRPAHHHDPTPALSSARAGVLHALTQYDAPVTVQTMAMQLGLHANTVREHLEALVDAGLAVRSPSVANRRGRPAILYRALPPESVRPHLREYADLSCALAERLAQVSLDPRADALAAGRTWGHRLGDLGSSGQTGARQARSRTLEILVGLGFQPEERQDGTVDLRSCPLLEAARRHPEVVCGVHLGMLRGVYEVNEAAGDEISLSPFATATSCVLHLPEPAAAPKPKKARR